MVVFDIMPETHCYPEPTARDRPFRALDRGYKDVVYDISLIRWFEKASEPLKNRIYSLIVDKTNISDQRIIDEHEGFFKYSMTLRVTFIDIGYKTQFESLIRRIGAKIDVIT